MHLPYGQINILIVCWISLLSDKKREAFQHCTPEMKTQNKNCSEAVRSGINAIERPEKKIEKGKGNTQKIRCSRERIENKPINRPRNYELRGCWNTKLYSNVIPNAITHIKHTTEFPIDTYNMSACVHP